MKTVKKQAKPATKVIRDEFKKVTRAVRSRLNNTKNKIYSPKRVKKLTKVQKKELQEQKKRAIIGIGLLFVVVSIIYSTYITRLFVDTTVSLVALAPQAIFAVTTLIYAFSKIYK